MTLIPYPTNRRNPRNPRDHRLRTGAPSGEPGSGASLRRCGGFTMVEIALSLAIIAFALVAIIGVLPQGIQVQQQNREETVINQEGQYLLDAISSGARGLDQLTNHFQEILVMRLGQQNVNPTRFASGAEIIGLLSTPRELHVASGRVRTNRVTARVKAINGSALQRDPELDDVAFTYLLTSEVIPLSPYPNSMMDDTVPGLTEEQIEERQQRQVRTQLMRNNAYEIRLTFEWPLLTTGSLRQDQETGNGRKVFRTLVSGRMTSTNVFNDVFYYFLEPHSFSRP